MHVKSGDDWIICRNALLSRLSRIVIKNNNIFVYCKTFQKYTKNYICTRKILPGKYCQFSIFFLASKPTWHKNLNLTLSNEHPLTLLGLKFAGWRGFQISRLLCRTLFKKWYILWKSIPISHTFQTFSGIIINDNRIFCSFENLYMHP